MAVKWYKLVAEQGHPDAQYTLGNKYAWGLEVLKSDEVAIKWYELAARQGYKPAKTALNFMQLSKH